MSFKLTAYKSRPASVFRGFELKGYGFLVDSASIEQ
jgi:hypothetical protein